MVQKRTKTTLIYPEKLLCNNGNPSLNRLKRWKRRERSEWRPASKRLSNPEKRCHKWDYGGKSAILNTNSVYLCQESPVNDLQPTVSQHTLSKAFWKSERGEEKREMKREGDGKRVELCSGRTIFAHKKIWQRNSLCRVVQIVNGTIIFVWKSSIDVGQIVR